METTISKRLRLFINQTGLSDKEFAEKIDCTKQEVSNWIHGTKIGLNRIIKISEVWPEFNVSWFITGKEGNEKNAKENTDINETITDSNKIDIKELYKIISEQQKTIIRLQEEKIEWLSEQLHK